MSLSYKSICILACSIGSQYVNANTPDSIVGYWKLDESTSSPANTTDETGLNDGIVQGSITFNVSGVNTQSTSAEFAGSGQYIEIPHNDQYLLETGMVVFWFWPENTNSRYGLFSKDSTSFDTGGHLTIFQESNDKISVRLQSNTTSYTIYSTALVNEDAWNHVSFVFGTGGMELYLNGVLQGTNPYEGGLGPTSGGTGNFEPIVLGGNSWQSNNLLATPVKNFFPGKIDEVGLLSERWDSSVIADLYSDTGPGTDLNLSDFAGPLVFYVRTRGSDSNDGTTPGTAFRTIQHAVNSCTLPGNTVYVGPGTYFESVEIGLNAGSEAVSGTADNPTELIADPTGEFTFDNPGSVVIDGRDSSTSGISLTSIENWIIDGFTFESQRTYGIYGSSIGAQINNCIFDVPAGYAIYATATGDIKVADCTFNRNSDSAHAMWITPSNTTDPTSVLITRNDMSMKDDAYLSTGYQTGSSAIWSRPSNNRYTYGIIVFGFGSPLIDRVEISNNQISDFYLPIFSAVNSSTTPSTIIANNTVTGSLYSIYSYAYSTQSVTLINNIIDTSYFGMFSYAVNNASQTVSGHLESNLTMDMARYQRSFEDLIINGSPRFTDAAAGDFSLIEGSPAIDAGTSTDAPTVDIAGRARPVDGDEDEIAQIDLGAYELVTERQKLKMVQWREISGHRDMSSE